MSPLDLSKTLITTAAAVALTLAPSVMADTITARGSDSTRPLVQALAQAFEKQTGHVVQVEGGGSSKGAKDCLAGEVDLGFTSRGPKEKETQAGLVAQPYAIDGVAVIVNKNNPADSLTIEQLRDLFSGQTETWSDGKPVIAFTRPDGSGTRECFMDAVLGKDGTFGPKVHVKHHIAALATVRKAVTAVAYTSAGSLEHDDAIKVIRVNGIEPTHETIRDNSYPICRTLHLATKGEATGLAKQFIEFALSEQGQTIVDQAGYVTPNTAASTQTAEVTQTP